MAAAVRLFHRSGYAATSISVIAAEAGIERATFYYYFSSKEELLAGIVRSVTDENLALADDIDRDTARAPDKLRTLMQGMMACHARCHPLLQLYLRDDFGREIAGVPELAHERRRFDRGIERAVAGIVEQGYAEGSFRPAGPARMVAFGILGMLNWSHRWFSPDGAQPAEAIGAIFADLILSGLCAAE